MTRTNKAVAALTALALAVVSLACVLSCWTVAAPLPPCHKQHAHSCAPMFQTAEAPSAALTQATPASSAIALAPEPELTLALGTPIALLEPRPLALPPPLTLRI